MRNDLTDIVILVDRSGSMSSMRDDMEGGIRQLIADQKSKSGSATLTLVQFDVGLPDVVFDRVPLESVNPEAYSLIPRGGTALLDALGSAIANEGNALRLMQDAERPGLVVFVVVTDGEENSSREYTLEQIKASITTQQETYGWKFIFLGANQDAFKTGATMGFGANSTSSFVPDSVYYMNSTTSDLLGTYRHNTLRGVSNEHVGYTEQEQHTMAGTS